MQALLSTFGIDWHLLLAQAINFGVLAALLTWLLYKPVLKVVRERQELIAKGVEDAERAGQMLVGADSVAAERVARADTEAGEIVARARQTAAAESATAIEEARARALRLEEDARARAAEEAARALRESEREVARLAILAAEKVLRAKA
jgi:F-type H+-transporting ATPase subunit b